ncbi:recombinase family protein [Deinococcus altitudinis]|uniref:recombinase family protein n=1 Tax=Deinococcus altitudinis TaxID=468914 RepID=UPI00389273BC
MTRTLSYARVSTIDQADGYSLGAQREKAADYARFRGWQPPVHFTDEGVSGSRDTRPGLSALLAAVQPGDMVLAKDLTRIGRGGAVQTLGIMQSIEQRGGSVVLIDQNIDSSTSTGRMMLAIMAAFSQLEVEQTRERAMIGRTMAAKAGHWPSHSVPYGYQRGTDRRLEIDPLTAPHARRALEALDGRSLREAAALLNAEGVPSSARGGGSWKLNGLHDMLNNPAYVGRAQFRDIEVACPPLVDEDLWGRIHARNSSEGGTPKPALYPLTGHLRCTHGAPYGGTSFKGRGAGGQDHRAYFLSGQARTRYGCRCKQAAAEALEAEARRLLSQVLADPSDPSSARVLFELPLTQADTHAGEREEVRKQLSNLAELRVKGGIDLDDYMALRASLKARERTLAAPVEVERPLPPALLELAEAVRDSDALGLSKLLDLLEVRFTLTEAGELELQRLTPLWALA